MQYIIIIKETVGYELHNASEIIKVRFCFDFLDLHDIDNEDWRLNRTFFSVTKNNILGNANELV